MVPLQRFGAGVLAEIIRRQPPSKARTEFAWQLAVGPALARATVVRLDGSVLVVTALDPRWVQELRRARDVILARLQDLLGADQINSIRWNS